MVIDCLETVAPQAEKMHAKVVVVDNHSADGSADLIQAWIKDSGTSATVRLLVSEHNGGFAAGNNLGIAAESAEYYLLLNSDTLLRENALNEMLSAISSDESVGLLSPRLEWPDGTPQESCFRFHHPISQLLSSANTGVLLKLFRNFEVAHRISDESRNCSWTSFACILIRKTVLEQLDNLDEKFFMYFEDVEFCWRAGSKGWKIRNHPAAKVVHLRGGSSPVKSNKIERKRQAKYVYESRTRYFYLVYGHSGLLFANLLWTLGWSIALIRSVFQQNFSVPACKREWKDIWINFFEPEKPYQHPETYK